MSPGWTLRAAAAPEVELVVEVFLDSWRSYLSLLPEAVSERWTPALAREYWAGQLKRPGQRVVFAESAGRALGMVRFGAGEEPASGEVFSLYVRPEASGSGIGSALIAQAEAAMRSEGARTARLWVFAANEPARRFYERLGWRPDQRERLDPDFGELEIGLLREFDLGRLMESEMAQQPAALAALLSRREELSESLAAAVPGPPRGVSMVARGSSDNAAVYGRYLLEMSLRQPVALAAPSLWTRYGLSEELGGHLAIAVSQSGHTPEIVSTLAALGTAGATTVAITNDAESPLATLADVTIGLGVGAERAVPATKTFSATLMAMALIAEALGGASWSPAQWAAVLAAQSSILADAEPAVAAAAVLAGCSGNVQLGRGPMYAVALEGALKVAETTSLPATGFSSADFLHGPIAVAGPDTSVVAYVAPGPVAEDVEAAAERARAAGSPLIVVAEDDRGEGIRLPTPAGPVEALAPIAYAVRAQQLAFFATLALGRDPDRPPTLRKVTLTS